MYTNQKNISERPERNKSLISQLHISHLRLIYYFILLKKKKKKETATVWLNIFLENTEI